MKDIKITDSILYVGVDDKTLDLFESQYIIPNGVSYNSYVIMDEKITIMDTVDARKTEEWLQNVEQVLGGKTPSYLVVSHGTGPCVKHSDFNGEISGDAGGRECQDICHDSTIF